MAITWADDRLSSRHFVSEEEQEIGVTLGVHTSVGILSCAGACTSWHIEQLATGAVNILHAGQHGKVWHLGGSEFQEGFAKVKGGIAAL